MPSTWVRWDLWQVWYLPGSYLTSYLPAGSYLTSHTKPYQIIPYYINYNSNIYLVQIWPSIINQTHTKGPKHRLNTKVLHIAAMQITLLEHFSVQQGSYLEMPVVSLVLIQSGGMQTRRQRGGMALHCTQHSQALQWSTLAKYWGLERGGRRGAPTVPTNLHSFPPWSLLPVVCFS